jgi:hypothetical protein
MRRPQKTYSKTQARESAKPEVLNVEAPRLLISVVDINLRQYEEGNK